MRGACAEAEPQRVEALRGSGPAALGEWGLCTSFQPGSCEACFGRRLGLPPGSCGGGGPVPVAGGRGGGSSVPSAGLRRLCGSDPGTVQCGCGSSVCPSVAYGLLGPSVPATFQDVVSSRVKRGLHLVVALVGCSSGRSGRKNGRRALPWLRAGGSCRAPCCEPPRLWPKCRPGCFRASEPP